jgi:hypothetical protein
MYNKKDYDTCLYKREYNTIHLLPTGYKILFQDFFKIVPDGKNLHKVELTELSIRSSQRVTVLTKF